MKTEKLENFKGGWFIGNFSPTLLKTRSFDIAVKSYNAGDVEKSHVHKKATAYTLVLNGVAMFNDKPISGGTIVILEPGEWNQFKAITDVTTVVIKTPSAKNDKYTE